MTAAVCGCGHPHLPGQTWCYACDLPVPTNVPPAVEQTPPKAPAGGAQAINPPWWWRPWLYLMEPRVWWLRRRILREASHV